MNIPLSLVSSSTDLSLSLTGTYTYTLVLLSVIIASTSAYPALQVADKLTIGGNRRFVRFVWVAAGAISMGSGIWVMHFIAMLAFSLPISVSYDFYTTLASLVPGILASAIVLYLLSQSGIATWRLHLSGLIMGVGIGGTHFIGMLAMILDAEPLYNPIFLSISVFVAYILATTSLWLNSTLTQKALSNRVWLQLLSALIMGFAVAGSHYIGMAAVYYLPIEPTTVVSTNSLDLVGLRIAVAAMVTVILVTVFFTSFIHRQVEDVSQALRDSEAQAQFLLQSIACGVCGIDQRGYITFINQAAASMLGYAETPLIGYSWHSEFQHSTPEGTPYHFENSPISKALLDGTVHYSDEHLWRKGSTHFPVELTCSPIHKNGNPMGAVITFFDNTERKRAEEMKEQIDFSQILIQSLPIAAFVLNTDHQVISWNDACEELTGIKADTIIGTNEHWRSFYPSPRPCLADCVLAPANQCIENHYELFEKSELVQGGFHAQNWCTVRNGESRYLLIDAGPIYDRYGQLIAVVEVLRDITETKNSEKALIKARNAAEAATRAKSDFLATMSHEIRTPMNGVLGMVQVLGETELSIEQKDFLDTIDKSGKALLTIINDILDFSKTESGKLELEVRNLDIHQTVKDVYQLMVTSANDKGVNLLVDFTPDCPRFVMGDAGRIRQILLNLVGNALKFTDSGYVEIRVSLLNRLDNDVVLAFDIKDSGIGISEEIQGKLFQSFSQADASTTRKYGGTGLGLAVCKNLVSQMNGSIHVESQPEKGSTFSFTLQLPLSSKNEPDLLNESDSTIAQSLSIMPLNNAILLAEDNFINEKVAVSMLGKLGLRVDVARNGMEAIEKNDENSYDLILMDCNMPEMDGFQATQEIRKREKDYRIPIIALTANAMNEDREKCLAAGMDEFITKPFNKSVLVEMIEKWLGHNQIQEDSDPAILAKSEENDLEVS